MSVRAISGSPAAAAAGPARVLNEALRLAQLGWYVFPLIPGDNTPAIKEWEQRATADPDRITWAWNGPYRGYNLGVACLPSRIVVLDLDLNKKDVIPPDEWDAPGITDGRDVLAELYARNGDHFPFGTTPTVLSRSGALHLYYAAPDGIEVRNTVSKVGWLIDVRAGGGYITAPPTITRKGNYRWITPPWEATPQHMPLWLIRRAAPPKPPPPVLPAVVMDSTGYAASALRGELQNVLDAAEGTRNDTLNQSAFNLGTLIGAGRLDARTAVEALVAAGESIGLPPREVQKTVTSGVSAGLRNPRRTSQ
ncbi:bifunctional DNA primase/polymerase [Streptomyces sp. NPDC001984]|uniref:bifunctional DNA primase/polymerase n=1 Tax=Streptomyces sp. NPDC002619 TaxID=3364655 RepID=UPI0036A62891